MKHCLTPCGPGKWSNCDFFMVFHEGSRLNLWGEPKRPGHHITAPISTHRHALFLYFLPPTSAVEVIESERFVCPCSHDWTVWQTANVTWFGKKDIKNARRGRCVNAGSFSFPHKTLQEFFFIFSDIKQTNLMAAIFYRMLIDFCHKLYTGDRILIFSSFYEFKFMANLSELPSYFA